MRRLVKRRDWRQQAESGVTSQVPEEAVLQVKCPKRSWQAKGEPYEARHQIKLQS